MTLIQITELSSSLVKIISKDMPFSLSYKFNKLISLVDANEQFYNSKVRELLDQYALKDESGEYNFPYHYLRRLHYRFLTKKTISTKKRFSFCCTLLTNELLRKADFQLLDPAKNWYDVTISHWSVQLGMQNLLMLDNPVLHLPHTSRPWKRLKYTNPLLYYWRKITQKKDRI